MFDRYLSMPDRTALLACTAAAACILALPAAAWADTAQQEQAGAAEQAASADQPVQDAQNDTGTSEGADAPAEPSTEGSGSDSETSTDPTDASNSTSNKNKTTAKKAAVKKPGPVRYLKVKASGDTLTISWKKPKTTVKGYEVRWSESKTMKAAKKKTLKGAKKLKLKVSGLKHAKRYYVQVRSVAGKQKSAWKHKSAKTPACKRTELSASLDTASSKTALTTFGSTFKLSKSKEAKKLSKYLKKLQKRYKVSLVMMDLTTGEGVSSNAKRSMYSASTLKAAYVASLLKYKPSSRKWSSSSMRSTVVYSSNDAYASLRNRYGSSSMQKMHAYSGLSADGSYYRYRSLPTRDLAKLWVGTYWYLFEDTNSSSAWLKSLLTKGSASESFLRRHMAPVRTVYNKYGAYPSNGVSGKALSRNDAGIVVPKIDGKKHPYVLAIMSNDLGGMSELGKLSLLADDLHTAMVKAW